MINYSQKCHESKRTLATSGKGLLVSFPEAESVNASETAKTNTSHSYCFVFTVSLKDIQLAFEVKILPFPKEDFLKRKHVKRLASSMINKDDLLTTVLAKQDAAKLFLAFDLQPQL